MMLTITQVFCLFFAFIFLGKVIDKNASNFDKTLGASVGSTLIIIILCVEVLFK